MVFSSSIIFVFFIQMISFFHEFWNRNFFVCLFSLLSLVFYWWLKKAFSTSTGGATIQLSDALLASNAGEYIRSSSSSSYSSSWYQCIAKHDQFLLCLFFWRVRLFVVISKIIAKTWKYWRNAKFQKSIKFESSISTKSKKTFKLRFIYYNLFLSFFLVLIEKSTASTLSSFTNQGLIASKLTNYNDLVRFQTLVRSQLNRHIRTLTQSVRCLFLTRRRFVRRSVFYLLIYCIFFVLRRQTVPSLSLKFVWLFNCLLFLRKKKFCLVFFSVWAEQMDFYCVC